MELNNDLFKTLYERANQYAINHWGKEPDRLELEADYIRAVWDTYRCGDTDYEYEYISVENLTEDLDEVYQKRMAELEEQRKQAEIKRQKEQEERERRDKERRFNDYLKLKKEFEQ